jgi:hypothetical protein
MKLTEATIIERLRDGSVLVPLKILSWEAEPVLAGGQRVDVLATLESPAGKSFRAAMETKAIATPMAVSAACQTLRAAEDEGLAMIFVAPFVGPKQADMLARAGVSWADLSGNMVLKVPGSVYIERTGKPNLFPFTVPLRNAFKGTASLVSRALLLQKDGFKSLYEMADFINGRNGVITVSTISKTLKVLQDELLVRQERGRIWVIQRESLLERLAQGYASGSGRLKEKIWKFSVENESPAWWTYLEAAGVEFAFCGFYAAKQKGLAETTEVIAFVRSMDRAMRAFESPGAGCRCTVRPDSEFGQLSLIEPPQPGVWFDYDKNRRVVDDLQLYLEMMASPPRGPKIAELLRPRILGKE